jgi:polyferredoxin
MVAMARKHSILRKVVARRTLIQAAFALLWLAPFFRLHTVCSPVFHCYSCPLAALACPIGVLANFAAIHQFPFLAVGTLAAVGALFGSMVCGWACPFGFLQDLIGKIPSPKFRLPAWSGAIRYVVLVVFVLAVPYFFSEASPLFFCRLCPAGALEGGLPLMASQAAAGEPIQWMSLTKISILTLVLGAMLFTWRPWCTVLCPLGAIFGLLNRVSFWFVRFEPGKCNDCEICGQQCDVRGPSDRRAAESRCIRCLECVRCGALSVGSGLGRPDDAEEDKTELITLGETGERR